MYFVYISNLSFHKPCKDFKQNLRCSYFFIAVTVLLNRFVNPPPLSPRTCRKGQDVPLGHVAVT